MKSASIYKLKNGYIIHSSSKTTAGFWISDEPYFKLGNDATIEEVVNKVLLALQSSKNGIIAPIDSRGTTKEFLKLIGLKSLKELHENSVKYCSVSLINNTIIFGPSKHAEHSRNGFLYKPENESVRVPFNANFEQIGNALADAFSKCE